jgi:hypothetical protein
VDTSEDESKPVATLGLSTAFDSAAATLRLAALTGTQEDVEEFSKTFKMPVPNMEDINRAAPALTTAAKPKIEPPVFSKPKEVPLFASSQNTPSDNEDSGSAGKLILIAAVLLVLLGLGYFYFLK